MSSVGIQPSSMKRDRAKLVLLIVGYVVTGPFVLAATALASGSRDGGLYFLPIIVWLAGITFGIVHYRTHPWAAMRVSRYILIVVALAAVAALVAPLFLMQVTVGPFD